MDYSYPFFTAATSEAVPSVTSSIAAGKNSNDEEHFGDEKPSGRGKISSSARESNVVSVSAEGIPEPSVTTDAVETAKIVSESHKPPPSAATMGTAETKHDAAVTIETQSAPPAPAPATSGPATSGPVSKWKVGGSSSPAPVPAPAVAAATAAAPLTWQQKRALAAAGGTAAAPAALPASAGSGPSGGTKVTSPWSKPAVAGSAMSSATGAKPAVSAAGTSASTIGASKASPWAKPGSSTAGGISSTVAQRGSVLNKAQGNDVVPDPTAAVISGGTKTSSGTHIQSTAKAAVTPGPVQPAALLPANAEMKPPKSATLALEVDVNSSTAGSENPEKSAALAFGIVPNSAQVPQVAAEKNVYELGPTPIPRPNSPIEASTSDVKAGTSNATDVIALSAKSSLPAEAMATAGSILVPPSGALPPGFDVSSQLI